MRLRVTRCHRLEGLDCARIALLSVARQQNVNVQRQQIPCGLLHFGLSPISRPEKVGHGDRVRRPIFERGLESDASSVLDVVVKCGQEGAPAIPVLTSGLLVQNAQREPLLRFRENVDQAQHPSQPLRALLGDQVTRVPQQGAKEVELSPRSSSRARRSLASAGSSSQRIVRVLSGKSLSGFSDCRNPLALALVLVAKSDASRGGCFLARARGSGSSEPPLPQRHAHSGALCDERRIIAWTRMSTRRRRRRRRRRQSLCRGDGSESLAPVRLALPATLVLAKISQLFPSDDTFKRGAET